MADKIRVMLIEDELPVRDAYARWLEHDGRATVVAEADTQQAAIARLEELTLRPNLRPDVIALDLGLPATGQEAVDFRGGLRLLPRLRELAPESRILIVTQGVDDEPVVEAFCAGADGYVWKNDTGDAIATAIVKVHEGKLVATASVAEKILGRFRDLRGRDQAILPRKQRHRKLSDVLYRTMKMYCYDGLSAKEIAERENVSVEGVNSRIKKAKVILGASSRREAFRLMSELSDDTT